MGSGLLMGTGEALLDRIGGGRFVTSSFFFPMLRERRAAGDPNSFSRCPTRKNHYRFMKRQNLTSGQSTF